MPDLARINVCGIMRAMYYQGVLWGGGQASDDFLVMSRCEKTNSNVVFVCAPTPDVIVIKTTLRPDHARANISSRIKSGAKRSKFFNNKHDRRKDVDPIEKKKRVRYKRKKSKAASRFNALEIT